MSKEFGMVILGMYQIPKPTNENFEADTNSKFFGFQVDFQGLIISSKIIKFSFYAHKWKIYAI